MWVGRYARARINYTPPPGWSGIQAHTDVYLAIFHRTCRHVRVDGTADGRLGSGFAKRGGWGAHMGLAKGRSE
eukprot:2372339-Alexandrium_andersonii.AAC.1